MVAAVDAQIVLALAWVETLLQLEELPAYSEEHFLDLTQVDLILRERWSATHWTAEKGEQTTQQGPGLMMAVTAHLFFAAWQQEAHGRCCTSVKQQTTEANFKNYRM